MNILFIASTGVYQALIAAHLHMDTLKEDYRQLPHFADYDLEQNGKPLYLGDDSSGNRVFALGVGPDVGMVKKCIEQLRSVLGASPDELQIISIVVNYQLFILMLHRIARLHILRSLSIAWITKLIRRDLPLILDQLQQISGVKTAI